MTHPDHTVDRAVALGRAGLPASAVAERTGVARGTVRDWLAGNIPARARDRAVLVEQLPPDYVHLLGLYLGDGWISGATAVGAIHAVLPENSVRTCRRNGCHEVYCYSKAWPRLFPQHGQGRKHERRIALVEWQQRRVESHPERLLRGLIESDGCRFMNTGRRWTNPRYSFTNVSPDIRDLFCEACDRLGVHWTWAPPKTLYVSRKGDVERIDEFVGPKA